MDTAILAAVLGAAMLHATWNAIVKSRADSLTSIAYVSFASGVVATAFVPLVAVPPAAAWPYLIGSTLIHTVYNLSLATAYARGEFSRVYPIARGTAPLLVTVASLLFFSEELSLTALAAIGLLLVAILGVAWRRAGAGPIRDRSLAFAALTAVAIAGYTLADGFGGRAAGDAPAYAIWLFFLHAWPTVVIVVAVRGARFMHVSRRNIGLSCAGGVLSMTAYGVVIWAMSAAPVAIVAALRESSILFASLIGVFVLRERIGAVRAGATILLVASVVILRFA